MFIKQMHDERHRDYNHQASSDIQGNVTMAGKVSGPGQST